MQFNNSQGLQKEKKEFIKLKTGTGYGEIYLPYEDLGYGDALEEVHWLVHPDYWTDTLKEYLSSNRFNSPDDSPFCVPDSFFYDLT